MKSAKAGQVRQCGNCCSKSGSSPPRRAKSAIVTLAAPKAGQVRRANASHTTITATATATAVLRGPFFLRAPDQANAPTTVCGECAKAGRELLTQHTASQEHRIN